MTPLATNPIGRSSGFFGRGFIGRASFGVRPRVGLRLLVLLLQIVLPDGAVADLSPRAVLWRLVEVLAARRREAPGAALSPDELIAAAWPGEALTGPVS